MKKLINLLSVIVITIIVVGIARTCIEIDEKTAARKQRQKRRAEEKEVKKVDEELQKKRLDHINKLASMGIFDKNVNPFFMIENGIGKIYVAESFFLLSEKEQNTFLEVPFAYVYDELGETDIIFAPSLLLKMDNGTLLGKRVGDYNPIRGVKFYK